MSNRSFRFRGHRRQMRRPVAGGLPAPDLEAWLEPIEDQPTLPVWACGLLGFTLGAAAIAGAGFVALIVIWRRIING